MNQYLTITNEVGRKPLNGEVEDLLRSLLDLDLIQSDRFAALRSYQVADFEVMSFNPAASFNEERMLVRRPYRFLSQRQDIDLVTLAGEELQNLTEFNLARSLIEGPDSVTCIEPLDCFRPTFRGYECPFRKTVDLALPDLLGW